MGEMTMQRPSSGERLTFGFDTKACPRCGQLLFADMGVCYGCLYEFGRREEHSYLLPDPIEAIPLDEPDALDGAAVEALAADAMVKKETRETEVSETMNPREELETSSLEPDVPPVLENGTPETPPPLLSGRPADVLDRGRLGLWIQTADVEVVVPLSERGLTFGRQPTCDVVLHDRAVSRMHARFVPTSSGAMVYVLGATNLPMVEGKEIEGSRALARGDTVQLCGTLVTLVEGAA